jgi:hypothetical protein
MMPAGSFMDFSNEGDSIFLRYASLEYPCGATLVELPVDYREGLGALHNFSPMDGVFWKFAPHQVGQVRLCPNCFDEHNCCCIFGEIFCSLC